MPEVYISGRQRLVYLTAFFFLIKNYMHDTDKLKITEILEQASTLGLISTLKALKELLPVLTSLYEQSLKESAAPDTRPGADTYGYKNAESILANCEYISDRWNNSFRLRWLIDLCKLEKYETNS